jgi:hypothetical protein
VSCLVVSNVVDIQVDTFNQLVATTHMVRIFVSAKHENVAWTVNKASLLKNSCISGMGNRYLHH